DDLPMPFMQPMADEIIRLLHPSEKDAVLDVASGTGEPGLTIARMIPQGKVFLTDLSEGMLQVAKQKATSLKINNIKTVICDVSELPFEDNTFNAVSCRFGFMFFPDMLMAAKEMFRVLKPGGRLATAVWDIPEKNFWVTAMMGTINKHMDLPPNPSGAPGMFRCSKSNMLVEIFNGAGFKNTSEKEVNGKLNADTAENYWSFMTEVGAPIVAALGKADEPTKIKIKKEVSDLLMEKYGKKDIVIDSGSLVIYGEK
ncbi:MAG: class I SAM-dependent methyltransferase, partial [Chitinophagaceae bacterium]|nr:class I SAM-dependent methyltransferase [Chitinophagaceae bacterium]